MKLKRLAQNIRGEHPLQFTTRGAVGHRIRVRGTVTYQQPGRSVFVRFVRDGAQGLRIITEQKLELSSGNRIEALGFPEIGQYAPVLEDSSVRRMGHEEPAKSLLTTADEILGRDQNANLIRIEARTAYAFTFRRDTVADSQAGKPSVSGSNRART